MLGTKFPSHFAFFCGGIDKRSIALRPKWGKRHSDAALHLPHTLRFLVVGLADVGKWCYLSSTQNRQRLRTLRFLVVGLADVWE